MKLRHYRSWKEKEKKNEDHIPELTNFAHLHVLRDCNLIVKMYAILFLNRNSSFMENMYVCKSNCLAIFWQIFNLKKKLKQFDDEYGDEDQCNHFVRRCLAKDSKFPIFGFLWVKIKKKKMNDFGVWNEEDERLNEKFAVIYLNMN